MTPLEQTTDLARAITRGQTEQLTIGELQTLTLSATEQRNCGGRGEELMGILRRHKAIATETASATLDRAKREKRELLASEKRTTDAALSDAKAINALMTMVERAEADYAYVPDSQRMAGGRPAEVRGLLPSLVEYETRAMSIGSDSAGGYLAPEQQSALFFDRLRARSIMLGLATQLPMDSSDLKVPGLSSSATAAMYAENSEITASDLAVTAITLTAKKLGAIVLASREVMADARPDLRGIIERDLISTMGLQLDYQLLEGDGAGANLRGLRRLVGVTATALGSGSGGDITLDAISAAISRMKTANATPGAIICHPRTEAAIKLLKDGDGHYIWQPSLSENAPARLFGLPIYTSSQISITETAGSANKSWLAVIDPSQLVVGRRAVVEILYDPYSRSAYDQVLIRATARFAGLGCLNAAGVELITAIN